jgi:hypothetical protein
LFAGNFNKRVQVPALGAVAERHEAGRLRAAPLDAPGQQNEDDAAQLD